MFQVPVPYKPISPFPETATGILEQPEQIPTENDVLVRDLRRLRPRQAVYFYPCPLLIYHLLMSPQPTSCYGVATCSLAFYRHSTTTQSVQSCDPVTMRRPLVKTTTAVTVPVWLLNTQSGVVIVYNDRLHYVTHLPGVDTQEVSYILLRPAQTLTCSYICHSSYLLCSLSNAATLVRKAKINIGIPQSRARLVRQHDCSRL